MRQIRRERAKRERERERKKENKEGEGRAIWKEDRKTISAGKPSSIYHAEQPKTRTDSEERNGDSHSETNTEKEGERES